MDDTNLKIEQIEKTLQSHVPHPQGIQVQSSVLVLLVQIENTFHILYTQRALHLAHQPGDVCFPGGGREGNETCLETALRETEEELGISRNMIHVLGQTDYIITNHGSIIYPFIGYAQNLDIKNMPYNKDEVEKVFTVPLAFFSHTQPKSHFIYLRPHLPEDFPYELIMGGRKYPFSCSKITELFYEYNDNIIWGITARITKHVLELLFENSH